MLGSPQGEFKDNVQGNGYGGSGFVGYQFPRSPVLIGLELGGMIYGYENRNVPLSNTIQDVYVDVETHNIFVTGHTVLRLQAPFGMVQPYIDGLFGFNHLFTETSVGDEDWADDYGPVFSSTNASDTGLSYGVAGGAMVKLISTHTDEGYPMGIYLDLRARMLNGANVNYLKEGSIRRSDEGVDYDLQRSKTDTIFFQAGLVFRF